MYACVDCRSPQATVLLFEPNAGDADHVWYVDAPSLPDWLRVRGDGTDWYEEANEGPEPTAWADFPPRTGRRPRKTDTPSARAS